MNLLQEYKELYYKEIEFSDRLNNKITTCITFLTILGSAQILLWTQMKNFELLWYTGVYLTFCCVSTALFIVCIILFYRSYSGFKTHYFPIRNIAKQNETILRNISDDQKQNAEKMLENAMAISFIFSFISFALYIGIDYYESFKEVM